MTAELEARKTAAAALLADFQRARDEHAAGALPSPSWLIWALRLASDLGIVLDQLGHEAAASDGFVLTAAQAATAVAGLTDAAEWHEYRASLTCADCAARPDGLCDEHAAGLDAAGAYRALARTLGGAA